MQAILLRSYRASSTGGRGLPGAGVWALGAVFAAGLPGPATVLAMNFTLAANRIQITRLRRMTAIAAAPPQLMAFWAAGGQSRQLPSRDVLGSSWKSFREGWLIPSARE